MAARRSIDLEPVTMTTRATMGMTPGRPRVGFS
jgi:hypothetical protein